MIRPQPRPEIHPIDFTNCLAGVDPGLDGSISFLEEPDMLAAFYMPVLHLTKSNKGSREVDPDGVIRLFEKFQPRHIIMEMAWNRPGNGGSAAFKSGCGYGIIRGIIAVMKLPVTFISPNTWKKALQIPAAKDGARARASQLMPYGKDLWPLVKDDGRAEASLIALYGQRILKV